jgi:hypothetical protein
MQVLQLFTELIAPPPNVICIKSYDFEWPTNSSSHFILLSIIFVVISIFSFSDTASLSSVMIC